MSNKKPNLENLKVIHNSMDAKEKGRKGGIKSGESRRRAKYISEELKYYLNQTDPKNGLTWRQVLCEGLIKSASNGNAKVIDRVMYLLGEPIKLEQNDSVNKGLEIVLSSETEKYSK